MNRDKQPVSACNMSVAQQEYVAREIRRHRQVTICRVMLLVLLLALWELAADMHWIDSFIFSSPVMIAKCLVSMAKDGSLFLHTGGHPYGNPYQLCRMHHLRPGMRPAAVVHAKVWPRCWSPFLSC